MVTTKERSIVMSVTRVLIFVMGMLSIWTDTPTSDICASISLTAWIYMPTLIAYELKLVDKYKSWRSK